MSRLEEFADVLACLLNGFTGAAGSREAAVAINRYAEAIGLDRDSPLEAAPLRGEREDG